MSDFKKGDRVVVLRLDSEEVECHGCYEGESGPIMFVLPDDDDLPDPVEVGADRVFPERRRRPADLPAHLPAQRDAAPVQLASELHGAAAGQLRW